MVNPIVIITPKTNTKAVIVPNSGIAKVPIISISEFPSSKLIVINLDWGFVSLSSYGTCISSIRIMNSLS